MPKVLLRLLLGLLIVLAPPVRADVPAHPSVVRVVSDNNYPPYLFLGPDGQPRGYLVDEWKLWQRKTGIPVQLIPTNWADAQKRLLDGRADVIDMLFETPDRARRYDFSPPWTRVKVGIYTDAGITGIDDASALKGFQVGVERGDACAERLQADGITNIRLFTNYTELIAAAKRHAIKIFCMDELPANYYLYRLGGQLSFSKAFDYYDNKFRRGVRKGNGAVLALVERGMAQITDKERDALERKWMGLPLHFTKYTRIFGYALLAVTLAGLALLVWVYTLRRAVDRRTRDLDFQAHHDAVTGLPNRRLLIQRLDHVIGQRADARVATLLVNLDNFKRVNEGFGHGAGDQLLRAVKERLIAAVPRADTVASLGGDEFAVAMMGHASPTRASAAAARIRHALEQPFDLGGREVFVGARIGISLYPHSGHDGMTLLKNATAAMRQAKRSGHGVSFYNEALTEQASHMLHLDTSLRRALQRDEFVLLYQPQVHVRSGRVVGLEALVRWSSGGKLVTPTSFIPFAEEAGLIDPIGQWVLQAACRQLARWLAEGLPRVRMAVNISPRQLASGHLVDQVREALRASQVPPELLELEITENALMEPGVAATEILGELRDLGVQLAIDDFGIGYSSLSYLRHFPVELLKIDQSFMRGVPEDPTAVEIASAIVVMAHTLRKNVLAEGVEDERQWAFLQKVGCDYAQGWYLGRPLPAEEAEAVLQIGTLALNRHPG